MLGCCEESLRPGDHRSDEHISKRVEKVGEAEAHNGVGLSNEDAKRRWRCPGPHGFLARVGIFFVNNQARGEDGRTMETSLLMCGQTNVLCP